MGDEYHSISCGVSGIMNAIEIVEGKDHPRQMGEQQYKQEYGKTGVSLLRLSESFSRQERLLFLIVVFVLLKL